MFAALMTWLASTLTRLVSHMIILLHTSLKLLKCQSHCGTWWFPSGKSPVSPANHTQAQTAMNTSSIRLQCTVVKMPGTSHHCNVVAIWLYSFNHVQILCDLTSCQLWVHLMEIHPINVCDSQKRLLRERERERDRRWIHKCTTRF